MDIKTIPLAEAKCRGFKLYKIPSRGYSCQTQNECLFIVRHPKTSYKKMLRTIENEFSADRHLSVLICNVPVDEAA